MSKTIIVGAGPAGMFAAYELKKLDPQMEVLLLEMGHCIADRQKQDIMSGVGGAGTFSDGKLHFTPVLSHEKTLHLYEPEEYQLILNYVDEIYTKFGVDAPYYPKSIEKTLELTDRAKKKGIKLFVRRTRHVGSDKLPQVIANFEKFIIDAGVVLRDNSEVVDFVIENNEAKGVVLKNGETLLADKIICAPGRIRAKWMQDIAEKYDLGYHYDKVEVGVRVEFWEGVMREFSDELYETVFMMRTPTFDDVIRTFCPCPKGHVATETYDGFVCVNGHSNSDHDSDNSNFAFVAEVKLTEPVENTIAYAKSIAQLAFTIGGGKPIVQRLADLRKGRRSTWDRIKMSFVKPTLLDVTPGDISMALPHRIVTNIIEGLDQLETIMPGIASGHTLLYAPEIKLRSSKIQTDKHLETKVKNFYVAGDGAGLSGNIIGAAANGIIAARGIVG